MIPWAFKLNIWISVTASLPSPHGGFDFGVLLYSFKKIQTCKVHRLQAGRLNKKLKEAKLKIRKLVIFNHEWIICFLFCFQTSVLSNHILIKPLHSIQILLRTKRAVYFYSLELICPLYIRHKAHGHFKVSQKYLLFSAGKILTIQQ